MYGMATSRLSALGGGEKWECSESFFAVCCVVGKLQRYVGWKD